MKARRGLVSRRTLLGLSAVLALACSQDKKTLLLVDVSLEPGVPVPTIVTIDVAAVGGASVGAVDFDWSSTKIGAQHFGSYLPDGVVGAVTVMVTGKDNGVAQSRGSTGATIEADKTNGPFSLSLRPVALGGDAGAEDSGATPDVDASIGLDGGVDASIVDAEGVDASAVDEASGDGGGDVGVDAAVAPAWESAEDVEKDRVSRSLDPVIAVEPTTENVFVAWRETNKVKVMRYDRKSGTWGAAQTLESRGIPGNMAVGTDASGNIIVAWTQDWSTSDPTLPGVWVSQSRDGSAWSPPLQIASGSTLSLSFAMARNGTARMAWSSETGTSQKSVFTAYFDKTSWKVDSTPVVDPSDPADLDAYDPEPRIMMGGTGDAILVLGVHDANKLESVGAVSLAASTRGALQILDTDTSHDIFSANRSAAMNVNGEGVVVWPQFISVDTATLNLAYYKPASGWSPVQKVATGSEFYTPGVTLDANGYVTVAWVQKLAASGANVMAIHGKVAGTWSEISLLERDNTASSSYSEYAAPMLAADGLGNVLAVWKKKISADTFGAYGSRLQGTTWQPEARLGLKTGLKVTSPRVAVADSGFGAATFEYSSLSSTSTDPEAYNVEVAFFR